MTTHTTPPDGWSEASDELPGAEQSYVYHIGDDERVLVGITAPSKAPGEVRLKVSSIEQTATVHRHDFVVATYDGKQDGIEDMIAFMRRISETLHTDDAEDERVFATLQRCIEAFNTTTDT